MVAFAAALLEDLRFAMRTLRRSPVFTAIAVLSIALGIGANTAIFTLVDQLLLRLLPVKNPEQLVMIWATGAHNGNNQGSRAMSYPMYQDFQQKASAFSSVFCRYRFSPSLTIDNASERIQAEMVSGNYFQALGVGPALGRVFTPDQDDRTYKGHPVVVLSHDYWQSRFSGDKKILGKNILVNNYPMTVVGVSAAGFTGVDPARSPAIRVPIQMRPLMVAGSPGSPEMLGERRSRWINVFARMKPGQTAASALASTTPLFKQILAEEVTQPGFNNTSEFNRKRFLEMQLQTVSAGNGYSDMRNSFGDSLVVLMCMVGLVLLIACSNVANLLIARAVARQKEIAVRLSIGASRWQLVRQLLVESLVLSLTGGLLGILLSIWTTRALLTMLPSEGNPLALRADPDLRVLGFSIALSVATGILFGLAPAFRSTKVDLWTTLKDAVGAVAGKASSVPIRKGLVAAQVALSFLLLFGAGLFVRSLQNLKATDAGFKQMDNLVTFQINPSLNGYSAERGVAFYKQLVENLRTIPGVKDAGFAQVALLHGFEWDSSMAVEGHTPADGEDIQAYMNSVSPQYFRTMGVALIEGRDFNDRDAGARRTPTVAIVNRKFAKHFFGDRSPIGRRLGFGGNPGTELNIEIVGVTEDSLYEGPREGVRRQVFIPRYQSNFPGGVAFYVRTDLDSSQMFGALRGEVGKLDRGLPVYEMKTLESQLDETLLTERLIALLATGFGGLATLLASIGLYGVMAFVVTLRTKEIGVRMALGASPGGVVWLVMKEVLVLLGLGLAVGVPVSLALGRYVKSQLYGMDTTDPWVAVGAAGVLGLVAIAAGLLPARRASTIDPIRALRYD